MAEEFANFMNETKKAPLEEKLMLLEISLKG